MKPAPGLPARVWQQLAFTWQVKHVVFEEKPDGIEWEVCVFDVLRVNDVVVAITANKGSRPVFSDFKIPDLELFGRYALFEALREGDCIDQPVSPGFVGDELCTVGEKHLAVDRVPIAVLRAGELTKIGVGEFRCVLHLVPLSFE